MHLRLTAFPTEKGYKFPAKGVTALCLLRPCLLRKQLPRKSEPPRTILLRKQRRRGERVRYAVRREAAHEHSRSTAPVGLRRMRELRNCHIKDNFVTEAAHRLGAAETTERRAEGERWVSLPLTTFSYHSTRKKDFTERFFAKRSGERFKRGVRRSRTARKVRSAATTSV